MMSYQSLLYSTTVLYDMYVKLEPNMLKFLPIIPSSASHKIYPLFFF